MEVHLRAVNLKKLDPAPTPLNQNGEIGRAMISDDFSSTNEAPTGHPPKGIGRTCLEEDRSKGAEADPT